MRTSETERHQHSELRTPICEPERHRDPEPETRNITVVLVEPQGPLNIGSVCRVMMNFGFSELRLVRPQADHLSKQARDMAVKAKGMLPKARIFASLADALSDCHLSIGTTRRTRKYQDHFIEPPELTVNIAKLPAGQQTALVFGREDSGLTTAELDLCQLFLTISTHDSLPSMNLAQAVTVVLYELSKGVSDKTPLPERQALADNKTMESMLSHMRQTLIQAEYLDPQNPDHIMRTFRRIFGRVGLDEREVNVLHGLWSRIDWLNSYAPTAINNKNGK